MKRMKFLVTLLGLFVLVYASAQEVVREEFINVQTDDVQFENFQGVVINPNTVAEIRGIGRALANMAQMDGQIYRLGDKYAIRESGNEELDGLLSAAIIYVNPDALVENVRNLRLIISGYLEVRYGYSMEDADTLAYFLTFYNAIHRGDVDFFASRYKPEVMIDIDQSNAGLATSYNQWPGRTRIFIPLSFNNDPFLNEIDRDVIDATTKDGNTSLDMRDNLLDIKEESLAGDRVDIDNLNDEIQQNEENLAALEEALQNAKNELEDLKNKDSNTEILRGDFHIIIRVIEPDGTVTEDVYDNISEIVTQHLPEDNAQDATDKDKVYLTVMDDKDEVIDNDKEIDEFTIEEYTDASGNVKNRVIIVIRDLPATNNQGQGNEGTTQPGGNQGEGSEGTTQPGGNQGEGSEGTTQPGGDQGQGSADTNLDDPAIQAKLKEIQDLEDEIAALEKENQRLKDLLAQREADLKEKQKQIEEERAQLEKDRAAATEETQPGNQDGKDEGTQPGNQDGKDEGTQPGNQDGKDEGTQPGNQDGKDEGTQPGNQDGKDEGTQPGNQDGKDEGTQLGNQDGKDEGTQPGNQDGKDEGTQPGNQDGKDEGTQLGNQDGKDEGTQPGNQDGKDDGSKAKDQDPAKENETLKDKINNDNKVNPSAGKSGSIYFMLDTGVRQGGRHRNAIVSFDLETQQITSRSPDNIASRNFALTRDGLIAITEHGSSNKPQFYLTILDKNTLQPIKISDVPLHSDSFIYIDGGDIYAMSEPEGDKSVLLRFNANLDITVRSEAIVSPGTTLTQHQDYVFVEHSSGAYILVLNRKDLSVIAEIKI
ncbi:P83/100 family protein [Entomospira entomophila]|uniref:Uncharacterized protein n=1 Tax=Entomospira entomophila TaxID=2719988 RepID=A0A968KQZ8_9SPIO|nr:P83/100 family protein [Entomospira entomophilus]NIZ40289.1 hypothetical protein [Entomospira entomophilus]WDI35848.1 P83/100 family protein [Entomospira entomophilus]